ncbi:hypothetical protein QJQ45_021119 [Haematococcus lacustris]|nr:hypothetical protein QJQ45_021119 [Haematococcus lacustris]
MGKLHWSFGAVWNSFGATQQQPLMGKSQLIEGSFRQLRQVAAAHHQEQPSFAAWRTAWTSDGSGPGKMISCQPRFSAVRSTLVCTPGAAARHRRSATMPALDRAGASTCMSALFRIKDPKVSLDFYTRILGFTLLERLDFPDMKFSLYFLGYYPGEEVPNDPKERVEWLFSKPATLELTHNHGTESDPDFKCGHALSMQGYHNGNTDPRGFGHIGLSVPDVEEACKRFEE